MLERFTATAFKTLREVQIDLGTINVFVGANGSGKSNLLEAIGVLGAAASGRVNDESLKYRGVRPGLPILYKSSFRNTPGARHIKFEAKSPDASYLVSLWNPTDTPLSDWKYKHESLISGDVRVVGRSPASYSSLNENAGLAALKAVELAPEDSAGQLLDLLRNYAIYSVDTPTLRGLEPDPQSREPVGLAGGRLPEALQSLLQNGKGLGSLFDMLPLVDWLARVSVTYSKELPISASVPQQQKGLRFKDRFMTDGRNILSAYDASEGVLYLLFYTVLALHHNTPKLFAIDNFDQALNPRVAREFTRMFCNWLVESNDRQVLLTTHNPLVLDGLPLQDDRVRLFAVDRSKQGKTVVHRVEVNESLLKSARKGIPLSQQWVNGDFGGIPSDV